MSTEQQPPAELEPAAPELEPVDADDSEAFDPPETGADPAGTEDGE